MQKCAQICDRSPECVTAEYVTASGHCQVKGQCQTTVPADGIVLMEKTAVCEWDVLYS